MPIFNHLEESGEEVLAKVEYAKYTRVGRCAQIHTRGLTHPVDLQRWLEARDNERDTTVPPCDSVIVLPYSDGNVFYEDASNLAKLCATWRIPGEIMRHLLSSRDYETEASRDNIKWNSWTLRQPPSVVDISSCYVATALLQEDGASQLRVLALIPVDMVSSVEKAVTAFFSPGPAPAWQLRALWLRMLLIWVAVDWWKVFSINFTKAASNQVRQVQRQTSSTYLVPT
jgi:hypothetical protein